MERIWTEIFGINGSKKLLLASASPRRQQLLRDMGFVFDVLSLDVDESFTEGLSPRELAMMLSRRKAQAIAQDLCDDNTICICADTIVAAGEAILAKPGNASEAAAMLGMLSGRMHQVYTGVTLRGGDRFHSFVAESKVWFDVLSSEEIEYYISAFKPYDKAGSYGIQEWIGYIGIERIEGSYYNVMGLPTHLLYKELMRFALDG